MTNDDKETIIYLTYAVQAQEGWGACAEIFGVKSLPEGENELVLPNLPENELIVEVAHEMVRCHQRDDKPLMAALGGALSDKLFAGAHLMLQVSPEGVKPGIIDGSIHHDVAMGAFTDHLDALQKSGVHFWLVA